jgi:hypothetical protein
MRIHTVLAWIAQANRDDNTAEVELRMILSIDPGQTARSREQATFRVISKP